jgi:transposase
VLHALERCPDCGSRLRGQSVARTRQVIELPEPQPVSIIEHRVLKRHCPVCERWWTPQVDFGGQVLGQGRCGVRLVSLIAYLRQSARLPVRTIQQVLATLHRLHLSVGTITALLQRLHQATQPEQEALRAQARASPIVHMDETGWRENGQNGYVWGTGEHSGRSASQLDHPARVHAAQTLSLHRGSALAKRSRGIRAYWDHGGRAQGCAHSARPQASQHSRNHHARSQPTRCHSGHPSALCPPVWLVAVHVHSCPQVVPARFRRLSGRIAPVGALR